jgi:hypothetical protein
MNSPNRHPQASDTMRAIPPRHTHTSTPLTRSGDAASPLLLRHGSNSTSARRKLGHCLTRRPVDLLLSNRHSAALSTTSGNQRVSPKQAHSSTASTSRNRGWTALEQHLQPRVELLRGSHVARLPPTGVITSRKSPAADETIGRHTEIHRSSCPSCILRVLCVHSESHTSARAPVTGRGGD